MRSRTKEVRPRHKKDEDEEEMGDERGIEEFEREENVDTNVSVKRTARDEEKVIEDEDEDETQLPEDYEARERVQPGADY